MSVQYHSLMQEVPAQVWIAACAHQLQQRWRTVDPVQLEEIAMDLGMMSDSVRCLLMRLLSLGLRRWC